MKRLFDALKSNCIAHGLNEVKRKELEELKRLKKDGFDLSDYKTIKTSDFMNHTNLTNEIYQGKKPTTHWYGTVIAMVIMIVTAWLIFIVVSLLEVIN